MARSFAKFLSEMEHSLEDLSKELEISPQIIAKWKSGTANPHPLIRSAVWNWLNDRQMEEMGMELKSERFKNNIIPKVREIFAEADFYGLIKGCGAPKDEYDSEADDVLNRLYLVKSKEDLKKSIAIVFGYYLNIEYNPEKYEDVAEKLWKIKTEYFHASSCAAEK